MKIAYVATIRLPTEKAHGYAIMRQCAAWAALGHTVVLYVPQRKNKISEDPFAYYGVSSVFKIEQVPCYDWVSQWWFLGPYAYLLQTSLFSMRLGSSIVSKEEVVVTRDTPVAALLSAIGYSVFYNVHTWRSHRAARLFLKRVKGIIAISEGVRSGVMQDVLCPSVVVRSSSDSNPYYGFNKLQLRKGLNLPENMCLALYTGHLYTWKGASVILDAAIESRNKNVQYILIGGTEKDVAAYKKEIETGKIPRVSILGHKKKAEVAKYTAAADVLLLPNTADAPISKDHTSPLKLFEYMTSGVPIIASDLPSIREVVDESCAYVVKAGNASEIVRAVERICAYPREADEKAQRAHALSKKYTWEEQAQIAIEFISKHTRA